MSGEFDGRGRPVSDRLHPLIYATIIGLILWFVLSLWGFAGSGDADYLLAVVSGFLLGVVLLTFALRRAWLGQRDSERTADDERSFGDWASGRFDTWQDRRRGASAAVEVLLPIAAAAFGMTAFAIVLHFIANGVV